MQPSSFDSLPGIAAIGYGGANLVLRVRDARGRWLRVHEDGALEIARGDARTERERVDAGALSGPAPLALIDSLHRDLVSHPLTKPSPWPRFYPLQVFRWREHPSDDAELVEGYIGIESEMGCIVDVFGVRGRQGREIVGALNELLSAMPR